MKNLFKKIIASFMCFSLLTLQATLAGAFDNTTVLPGSGNTGADIIDHTEGLIDIKGEGTNNADLIFGKDTVINWGHLNVGKDQVLNFTNGNYAVLNNVLNGMSNFAGLIKGENGMIIISNPNGMIMNGGSIETSGALILTTQDLYTKYHSFFNETNGIDKNALQELLKDPQFKDNTYSIISINNGLNGKISASDINIIAKGIDLNSANITGTGNITFTTSDGANFMAASKDASKTNNIAFNYGDSIQIANSSIKANDGTGSITLIAGKGDNKSNISVNGSILTGNTNIEGLKIGFNENKNSNTTVNGDLTINSDGKTGLFNTSVTNKADITSNKGKIYLSKVTADSLDLDSHTTSNIYDSTITNGVVVNSGTELVPQNGSTKVPYASFYMENSTVGSLDVTTENGAIQLNGGEVVVNAKLTAGTANSSTPNGNIIIGYSSVTPDQIGDAYKNSTKIGGNIEVSSTSWVEANSNGNLVFINPEVGDYFHVNGKNVAVEGGYIHGDAVINALQQATINGKQTNNTTFGGDLIVTGVDKVGIFNSNITGLGDITSSQNKVYLSKVTADSLDLDSHTTSNIYDSTITNGVTVKSGKKLIGQDGSTTVPYSAFYMGNSTVGSLDVTTENGAIQLNGGEVVGNAKLTANTDKDSTPNGNIIIGYSSTTPDQIGDAYKNSTKIGGNIEVSSTSWTKAYSEDNLNFTKADVNDDFIAESKNGHVSVKNADVEGNADFTAKNGVKIWFSDFAKDLTAKFTGDHSVKVPSDAMQTDPPHDVYIAYSQVHGNADLKAQNASDATITVSNTTIDNNLKATSAGNVSLWQAVVGKNFNAKTENGNINLSGGEKRTEVGSITADSKQNININNTDIKGSANLKAGSDIKSTNSSYVGNIIANAKNGSFKDSKGDLKFYNTNIENKLSANTDGNISLDSNANNVNEALMNKIGSIDFKTENGNINIWDTNVSNDTKLTSENGKILLADSYTKTANITNNQGNISVSNVKADVVNTTHKLRGETVISSKGNKINELNSVATGEAKITLNNANVGNANLSSQNGNITINSTTADNISASNKNDGKISMMYSNIKELFQAKTEKGDIVLDADTAKMNQTVGSLDLKTEDGNINIWDTNVTNNAELGSVNGNILSSNANYGGVVNVDAAKIANFNTDKNITFDTVSADTFKVVSNNENIGIIGNIIADKINLTATNGSIYATTNALLDGNTYNLKALNQIASLDDISEVMNKTDYDWSLQNAINISGGRVESLSAGIASVHSNGDVTFVTPETTKSNLRLSSDGDLKINKGANVAGNLLTQADGSITTSGNIIAGLDVKAFAANDINLSKVVSGRNLELSSSKGNITIDAGNDIKGGSIKGDSSITAKNGNIISNNTQYGGNIKANAKNATFDSSKAGKLNFVDSNITENLTATADNKVALNNSTVGGKFIGKSNNYETTVNNSTVGSAELISKWNNSFNNSTSNGDVKMSSEGGHSTVNASTIKGNAELTAKGNSAINGSTVEGDATVKSTDGKASIWESIVGKKATVTSENYEAAIGAGEGKTSQVGSAEITSKYNNRLYNTTVNEDAKLTSTNGNSSVSNATIKGNAELTAKGNSAINGSTVDGDATVKSIDGKASIWESIVGKKATVTSENYEAAIGAGEGKTSQVGSAEITSKYNNRLYNTTVNGDAKLTSTNGNSSVSNATIKGNAELTAKGSAAISDSNIESNATVQSETGKASIYKSSVTGIAKVTSSKNEAAIGESEVGTVDMYGETGARFYNSKSNGELKIKANTGDVNITNATVRNVNATSHKANINVKNTETTGNSRNHFTAKNGNVTSTNSNYIGSIKTEVGKTADFNTDKNITFDYVSADTLNVVSNNENIGIIGNIIADKINLTATNGSIYATTNALLDGNTYNLKALNQIAALDDISDVMNKTDYDWSLQNAINISGGNVESLSASIASVHSNGDVTFVAPETTKGNLRLSSDGNLTINNGATSASHILTQANGSITTTGNLKANDVKAYAADDINIENVNAGRNLELKSNKGNINLGNDSKASSVSGKTTLTADKDINVKNYTSTDSFNATSKNGAITLNKASVGNRAISAGQYKGITLNAKKDITVNNSYSHGKFIANSTEGSVTVGNTGVETQGSDITAGKDVNLNQFHSAAHVNITAGENVNAKAIGTSANQSIWTIKAGKDANFENLNLNNKNGGLNVEANNININNAPSVGIKPNVQGQVDLKANNDIKIENGTEFGSKLNATAGNNISLDRKGDLTINNSSPMSLKAGNTVSVSTDGQLVIDNLTSNDIVNGKNVNFAGTNITTNNSTYHTNVGMNSKGDVTFTGSNTVNGDLTISASKDSGFVAINGDSTVANNITVNGAQYIEANNVETGHLQFNDFEIGHIINTTADSTGFTNGDSLYVNILNTLIRNQELEPSITNSATNVDRIIFYPRSTDGGDGSDLSGLDEDAALILGYLRDKAIDTRLGSDFAPIGFAAHEGRRGGLHRMDIGDSVYRALQENIDTLHITDRFNIDQ